MNSGGAFSVSSPQFGNPGFGNPGFGNPTFGNPSFSSQAFSNPSFSSPAFSNPSFGNPQFPRLTRPQFTSVIVNDLSQPVPPTSKLLACGFVITLLFALACASALSIAALVIAASSSASCLAEYSAINFSYITWLIAYGWSGLGVIFVVIFMFVGFIILQKKSILPFITFLAVLCGLFQIAWFGVGTALYFGQVKPNCVGTLADFALANFIIQCVFIGLAIIRMIKNKA